MITSDPRAKVTGGGFISILDDEVAIRDDLNVHHRRNTRFKGHASGNFQRFFHLNGSLFFKAEGANDVDGAGPYVGLLKGRHVRHSSIRTNVGASNLLTSPYVPMVAKRGSYPTWVCSLFRRLAQEGHLFVTMDVGRLVMEPLIQRRLGYVVRSLTVLLRSRCSTVSCLTAGMEEG